jgi:hypothetical protein
VARSTMRRPQAAQSAGAARAGRPIVVRTSRTALRLADVATLGRTMFRRDWYGALAPHGAWFTVAADADRLYLAAGCALVPDFDATIPAGAFAAGLWERDVAELFVGRAGSTAYAELNVAPGGAWWWCAFSGYRTPAEASAAPAGVESFGEVTASGWRAGLAVPRPVVLGPAATLRHVTLNACMIVGGRDRRFLCWSPAPGEPDFHARVSFVRAKLAPVARRRANRGR